MSKRNEYIVGTSQILVLFLFFIRFGPFIPFLKYWGNEIVDSALAYFIIIMFWNRIFKGYPPKILPFIIAVGTGWFLEYLQFIQYKFRVFPVGTFDPLDLGFFVVGGLIALILDKLIENKTN